MKEGLGSPPPLMILANRVRWMCFRDTPVAGSCGDRGKGGWDQANRCLTHTHTNQNKTANSTRPICWLNTMTGDWWVPSGLLSHDSMTRLMMKKKCMQHPGQFRDNQDQVYTLMSIFTGRLHQWVSWRQSSESDCVVIILLMFFANRYPVWALLTGWRVY